MKATIAINNNRQFLDTFNFVGRAVPKRFAVPAIENIKVTRKAKQYTATATNLKTTINCPIEILTWEGGLDAILLPHKEMATILASLPTGPVVIEYTINEEKKTASLNVRQGKSNYNLQTSDVREYPKKFTPEGRKFRIPTNDLSNILKFLKGTTETYDMTPLTEGVIFIPYETETWVVSFGVQNMAVYVHPAIIAADKFIMPNSIVSIIEANLPPDDSTEIEISESSISVRYEEIEISTQVIDTSIMDFKSKMPKEEPGHTIDLDPRELLSAFRRTEIIDNDQSLITIHDGYLKINVRDGLGREAADVVSFNGALSGYSIGINRKTLSNLIKPFASAGVTLSFGKVNSKPIIIRPIEGEHFALAMPIMYNGDNVYK